MERSEDAREAAAEALRSLKHAVSLTHRELVGIVDRLTDAVIAEVEGRQKEKDDQEQTTS